MPRPKNYATKLFDEQWTNTETGERMTLEVYKCTYCGQSSESAFGRYTYCPQCGRRLYFEEVA